MTRNLIPRRRFLQGMAASAGVLAAGCSRHDPPTYGNILRMADNLTYKAHRLLLPQQALAREYDLSDISASPAIGTTNPADPSKSIYSEEQGPIYERHLRNNFADWRITVEGSVLRPRSFSLQELRRLPVRTQITRHVCEEGWSAIAQWTGVPLHEVLNVVGLKPTARYVKYRAYDNYSDCIDMYDALHPQTILAYGMNGRDLPIGHGAPLRLRVERQLGYKSMKFLRSIEVVDEFDDGGEFGNIQSGWSWYAGI
jgi:DMSO/TMAO reductase YedYZ molybdopterin-dependent catalytic subunit